MQLAITMGAGSDIGLDRANALHVAGMAIIGVGRDPAKPERLAGELADPPRLATAPPSPQSCRP